MRRAFSTSAPKVNWDNLMSKAKTPFARSEIARLQQAFGKIEQEAAAVSATVPPIDFKLFREKIGAEGASVVDALESAYKEIKFPEGTNTLASKADAHVQELLKTAKAKGEESTKRAKELSVFLEQLKANRTTKDTTIADVAALYPALEAEAKKEIKEHQWLKGLNV